MALIGLAIIVVMGIMAGGMVALALIGPRHTQNLFGILAGIGLALGLTATLFTEFPTHSSGPAGLINSVFNLALSGFLGYAVTTFFVLSYQIKPDVVRPERSQVEAAQRNGPDRIAVLYFVPAELEHYDARVMARGFETLDYPQVLPPPLLRPLYLLDLKRKYAAVGPSPYRATHFKLAQKVQDRLGKRYKVYIAFYSDHPTLDEAAIEALRNGARRLIVLHARLTSPPPTVKPAELLESLRLSRYGATLLETTPLWNSDLLPRLFVRRALTATEGQDRAAAGLLLIGAGHPQARHGGPEGTANAAFQRQNQELSFQKRVRQALIKAGFTDDKVVLAWLQWQHPTVPAGYAQLVAEGCQPLYWMASSVLSAGIGTLYDIPHLLQTAAASSGGGATALEPANDDDLVAEALVEKVKQVVSDD